ncbi:MAG TPA: hypothetical protein VGD84_02345 [Pseudonocardiaceae bacterium]
MRVRSVWLWVLLAVLAVILLGLLFGGYRKGVKVGMPSPVLSGLSVVEIG